MSANLSANFTALQAQVTQTTTVEQSAITLIEGLSSQLAAAIAANSNGDTAALPNLQSALQASASALAAAISANTPGSTTLNPVTPQGTTSAAPPATSQPSTPAGAQTVPAMPSTTITP